jgi:hypothetical protein
MKLEQKIIHNTGKNLEEIKNNIIYVMQEEIQPYSNISDDYEKFISECWYKDYSADVEPFVYSLFDKKWSQPWTIEELFEDVCHVLHKLELLGAHITDANKDEEEFDENDDDVI